MTALFQFYTKNAVQIRTDILRTISNGLKSIGILTPNVGQNSDYYITATALANELAVVHANTAISADNDKPTTATGAYLDAWGNLVGEQRTGASSAFGYVTCQCSVTSTTIPAGYQLVDPANQSNLYQVTLGGSYGSTTPIPVIAVNGGASTNQDHGYALQWVTTPAFMNSVALVGASLSGEDGLSGGADSEVGNDPPYRARILPAFSNPQTPGNSNQVISWCSAASPLVQSASTYPALLGPSTVFFTAWRAQQTNGVLSATSYNRSLPSTLINSTVVPYVAGLYESGVFINGNSTVDQPCDVVMQLVLPTSPSASPPGPGGGWLDGTPWPPSNGGTAPVQITSVSNGGTTIVVNATTTIPPTAGVTRIAFIDPQGSSTAAAWTLQTAIVSSFSGSSGAWTLNLNTAWPTATSNVQSATLSGTFACTNGSAIVPSTISQVSIAYPGNKIVFASQPATTYTILSVIPTGIVLTASYSGTTNAATTSTTGSGVGNFVFPQSVNQLNYLAATIEAFGNLGAGEWVGSTSVSFRRPLGTISWPYSLDGRFQRTVEDSGNEVEAVNWIYRQYSSSPIPSITSPLVTVPANTYYTSGLASPNAAPSILCARNIAWYPS